MNVQDEFENYEAGMEGKETARDFFEAGWNARGKQAEPVLYQYKFHNPCKPGEFFWHDKPRWNGQDAIESRALYPHPAPAVAQEPVHFRAVLCGEQQDQAFGVVPKVVGFVDKKAAEQFILEKRDFQGWRYSLEPLYTEAPAVAVNEQMLAALKLAQFFVEELTNAAGKYAGLEGQVVADAYMVSAKLNIAIAAAEQMKGGV